MLITPELEAAIEGLYKAFPNRQLKTVMVGCPCCSNDAELRHLSLTPLRNLGSAELETYLCSAIWTVGSKSDYQYFTPRLLELMVRENSFDTESVAKKLTAAEWRTWTQAEQAAIEGFFCAYWNATLLIDSAWCPAKDALCLLAYVFDDLNPFLNQWVTATEPIVLQQLIQFAEAESGNAWQGFICFPHQVFWSERQNQMKQVAAWLCSAETLGALEARWYANFDGPLANLLNDAVEFIAVAVRASQAAAKTKRLS